MSNSFSSVVKKGVEQAGADLGVKVEFVGPDKFDVVQQGQLIEAAIAKGPDGLFVSLPDCDALKPAVQQAIDAGIPVMSFNSGAACFKDVGSLVHIALVYRADQSITAYRNGLPYGQPYTASSLQSFAAGKAQVVFGLRHSPPGGNKFFAGSIDRAQLYDRALSAEEIAASAGVVSDTVTVDQILAELSPQERADRLACDPVPAEPPEVAVVDVKHESPARPQHPECLADDRCPVLRPTDHAQGAEQARRVVEALVPDAGQFDEVGVPPLDPHPGCFRVHPGLRQHLVG